VGACESVAEDTLNLFVEFRIHAETSHAEGVSHINSAVLHWFGGTRIGYAKRTGAVRRPVSLSMFRQSPAVPVCCLRVDIPDLSSPFDLGRSRSMIAAPRSGESGIDVKATLDVVEQAAHAPRSESTSAFPASPPFVLWLIDPAE
jgi:hypothetical protein